MIALLFYTIAAIALAAIAISFYLLAQRKRLKQALVSAGTAYAVLEAVNATQAEELHLLRLRERAIIRHAESLIAERNLLRAQLVACTEAPRFPVVTRGQA